jgi:hypothetical protein
VVDVVLVVDVELVVELVVVVDALELDDELLAFAVVVVGCAVVVGASVVVVAAALTTIVPTIALPCTRQWYVNVPEASKVTENESPGFKQLSFWGVLSHPGLESNVIG